MVAKNILQRQRYRNSVFERHGDRGISRAPFRGRVFHLASSATAAAAVLQVPAGASSAHIPGYTQKMPHLSPHFILFFTPSHALVTVQNPLLAHVTPSTASPAPVARQRRTRPPPWDASPLPPPRRTPPALAAHKMTPLSIEALPPANKSKQPLVEAGSHSAATSQRRRPRWAQQAQRGPGWRLRLQGSSPRAQGAWQQRRETVFCWVLEP